MTQPASQHGGFHQLYYSTIDESHVLVENSCFYLIFKHINTLQQSPVLFQVGATPSLLFIHLFYHSPIQVFLSSIKRKVGIKVSNF